VQTVVARSTYSDPVAALERRWGPAIADINALEPASW
jgi:hypothetical protein